VVTFLQVSADMAVAVDVPDGHGHRDVIDVADGWAAVLQPPSWTLSLNITSSAKVAMIRPVSKALTPADELNDVGRQLVQHDSSHMSSLWARPDADATAVPAMCGAPRVRRAIGSVDVKCVVSTVNLKTNNLPPTVPELANCIRRYTARTATLCQTTAMAARAGVRMDLVGSRGCGCTVRSNASKGVVDEREGSRRFGAVARCGHRRGRSAL
jgi:hypothetical protein